MKNPLATYLHDHLSGANFAIELLEKLAQDDDRPSLRDLSRELLQEIEEDRSVLRQIAERVGAAPHSFKEAVGWLGEKASRYKLSNEAAGPLATFESLEILTLGVQGKRGLWRALQRVASFDARIAEFDFETLVRRAESQHAKLEERRLVAVAEAFRPSEP